MATKLKNLKIKKVDFVDEGANPDAHIRMIKRKDVEQESKEETNKVTGSILKKLLGFIGKAAGMNQDEIESAMDEIQKGGSESFSEKYAEAKNRKIADEIWDICYALQSSLYSIINDEELDSTSTATAMQESLDEFHAVVQESITKWSTGKAANIVKKSDDVSEEDLNIMKSAVERLNNTIEKASKGHDSGPNKEGDKKEMKIDKSKMTTAERAFLEDLEKRYGTEEGAPAETPEHVDKTVEKSVTQPEQAETIQTETSGADDVYKGLHPAVKAELAALKKFKEDAEERELGEIAKKYEIIGKKKEELVPLFKSLKAAGGTAYADMIAVLDGAVETVEKSGAFSEIGKSGHAAGYAGAAETKIEGIAKKYQEKDPSLSHDAAIAKAWENNPDIVTEYEDEAGF